MGLLPAKGGVVALGAQDITRTPTHDRARLGIGFAPDDCRIFPDLSVQENLQISRWLGEARGGGSADERIFAVFPEVRDLLEEARRGREGRRVP